MEYTAIAEWLNTTFAGYDSAILGFMNTLATAAGGFLTPLMKLITFLGEKGIIMFLLAIGFMCFSRTRRIGVCMFGAVCCGALITNIILKDMVARPRPFEYMAVYMNQVPEAQRTAQWYYLAAVANTNLGNRILGFEQINRACAMDPANAEYAAAREQIRMNGTAYHDRQSGFGFDGVNMNRTCCGMCAALQFISCLFGRGGCPVVLCC